MRVVHLCGSHLNGGAARATYRIHRAILDAGVASRLRVLDHDSEDPTVICGSPPRLNSFCGRMGYRLESRLQSLSQRGFTSAYPAYQSTAFPGTGLLREDCLRTADLVHLHWIGKRLISIEEIGRLRQPLIWTLHDQWTFCGSEHHVASSDHRFVEGYLASNRPAAETGPDVNRITWLRKQKHWRRPAHLVAPSRWMADCVRSSALMHGWPTQVIPHPLDLSQWCPMPQAEARRLLGFTSDVKVILLVAHDAFLNPVKGADLLLQALHHSSLTAPFELLVIGQAQPARPLAAPVPVRFLGTLHDIISLRIAYAAADLLVVPSRQESFCQVATEAQACGRPVAAFAAGGLLDVVEDGRTGSLAQPFDPCALAASIDWILADNTRWRGLCQAARERAVALWSPQRIASAYFDVYQSALASGRRL